MLHPLTSSLTCKYQALGHQLRELKTVQAHKIVHDNSPEVYSPAEGPDPPRHLLRQPGLTSNNMLTREPGKRDVVSQCHSGPEGR